MNAPVNGYDKSYEMIQKIKENEKIETERKSKKREFDNFSPLLRYYMIDYYKEFITWNKDYTKSKRISTTKDRIDIINYLFNKDKWEYLLDYNLTVFSDIKIYWEKRDTRFLEWKEITRPKYLLELYENKLVFEHILDVTIDKKDKYNIYYIKLCGELLDRFTLEQLIILRSNDSLIKNKNNIIYTIDTRIKILEKNNFKRIFKILRKSKNNLIGDLLYQEMKKPSFKKGLGF